MIKGCPGHEQGVTFWSLLSLSWCKSSPDPADFKTRLLNKEKKFIMQSNRAWDKLPSACFGKWAGMLQEQTEFRVCASNSSFN